MTDRPARVRTVEGDISPGELGATDYHEHLLMRSPLLRGDELDDVERSAEEAATLRAAGIDAVVELTPIGLGRDPRGVATIAERTGMRIVLATGLHAEAHYPSEHWVRRVETEAFVDLFVRDVTEGCDGADYGGPFPVPTAIRAGVIKVGIGYWSVSPLERRVLEAAGLAHARTAAPVVCHLERGTAGLEAMALLEAFGVPPQRVALAHVDRNPDPGLLTELAASGVYLGFDGPGRAKYWPDSVVLDALIAVAEAGYADRLLLGGDMATRSSFRSYGGLPGMDYLPRRFVPRVRAAGGQTLVDCVLVENPARFLAFAPREEAGFPDVRE